MKNLQVPDGDEYIVTVIWSKLVKKLTYFKNLQAAKKAVSLKITHENNMNHVHYELKNELNQDNVAKKRIFDTIVEQSEELHLHSVSPLPPVF